MKKKILVVTPAFSGGSWVSIVKILEQLSPDAEIFVIGLGKVIQKNKNFKYFSVPYPRYDRWGFISAKSPALSLLWNIPLVIAFIFFIFTFRPKVIMGNGFSPSLILSPLIKALNLNLIILFHGFIGDTISPLEKKIAKNLSKNVDLVVVNSKGSYKDMQLIIKKNKIIINEHFADDIFFETFKKRKNKPRGRTNILYVGRLDREKLFYPLVNIAKNFRKNKNYVFNFAGVGEVQKEIQLLAKKYSSIKYIGYVSDRFSLAELYSKADVVWSFADETYLALPAVEALASGSPIIIPKYAALYQKAKSTPLVDRKLLQQGAGWFVDTNNETECLSLIEEIHKEGISKEMRRKCNKIARKKYSSQNIRETVRILNSYL